MASREKSSQIGDNQSERNSKINEELMKTARMYVKIWQKSPGKRRPNNFYGLTLNFAKGRDVESIIRDTFTEKLGNKWDSFIANIK